MVRLELAFAELPHDENTGGVCRVDLETLYRGYEPTHRINVAVLRYLYGLPLFVAPTDDEPKKLVDVWTWHELCIVAQKLEIVGLAAHALVELEAHFEEKMKVYDKTGLLQDKANLDWFVQNVKLIRSCVDKNDQMDAIELVLKFCCRHYTQLESNKRFQDLTFEWSDLLRDMLRYGARQKNDFLR